MRCIYKIINVKNNKFYVGSAVNFERRKAKHLWRLRRGDHSNRYLQASWDKYGENAFVFAVVQEVPLSENLLVAENVWLQEHVGKPYCYNLATDALAPGLGMFGPLNPSYGKRFNHTPEAKARIGAAAKARVQTETEKEKRRKTMLGHKMPITTREKISLSLLGDKNPNYGKPRSDAFKAKVSKAVEAVDPTGEVTTFPSIAALRGDLGLKPPTANRALKSGLPLTRGPYKGWIFRCAKP